MDRAAVVIASKNRLDDLRKAVASAMEQTVQPEIIVMDDGSSDGTAGTIRREFPTVRVQRSESSLGYIAQRNRGACLAASPIIFSIDDDAVFSSPTVIENTLAEFNHPRVGAVAIPFVEINRSLEIKQRAPESGKVFAAYTYIGTAHAVRRDLFLGLAGYREDLVHQGEEEDFCIRLLNAGFITRYGAADPIHHFESPRRSWTRMDYYGARNKILYCWQNVPFPFFPGHLAMTSVKTLAHNLQPRRFATRARGVLAGFAAGAVNRARRRPVSAEVYRLSRELKRRGAVALHEIESRLPEPLHIEA